MDRHTKAIFATLLASAVVLAGYFYLRTLRDEESPNLEAGGTNGAQQPEQVTAVLPAPKDTAPVISKPVINAPKIGDLAEPTEAWLVGWWADEGSCAGDSGETFSADGSWSTWADEGTWTLAGGTLTVTATTNYRDTASGEPEPINPPRKYIGKISEATDARFTLIVGGEERRLERCKEDL